MASQAASSSADAVRAQQDSVSKAVIAGVVGGATQELTDTWKQQYGASTSTNQTNAFEDLTVSQFEDVQAIESLCMQCHEQGTTKLLLTKFVVLCFTVFDVSLISVSIV
jgi:hypothetical protein